MSTDDYQPDSDSPEDAWDTIMAIAPDPVRAAVGPMRGRVKPPCQLVGEDGNIFSIMARASQALKRAGYPEMAREMQAAIYHRAGSYDEALAIVMQYVDAQ